MSGNAPDVLAYLAPGRDCTGRTRSCGRLGPRSQRCVFPRKDDNGTGDRQTEPKLASLGGHAAFQRQFWRPNSHFPWAVASRDPLLVARFVRSYGRFRVLPHAAVTSLEALKLPHKCTRWVQNPSISALELPQALVFLRPNGPKAEYFCTGRESWPRRRDRRPWATCCAHKALVSSFLERARSPRNSPLLFRHSHHSP